MGRWRLKNKRLSRTASESGACHGEYDSLVPLECIGSFSGDTILTCMVDPVLNLADIMGQIRIEIGNHMDVPYQCVNLTTSWSQYVVDAPRKVQVTLVAEEISDDDFILPCEVCCICRDPCKDADDQRKKTGSDHWPTRETNCVRCNPCCLCMRCKVTVGDESVCFLCLEPSEVENLTPVQNRRFILTGFVKIP
jgi:hypothetical protein